MRQFNSESLTHDPIHGYIAFTCPTPALPDEITERAIIDTPWMQRLRQIHQLQTAWWVFPSAEHTRFQHVIGAMHLGSRAANGLYESLKRQCSDVPSIGYVESLLRLAGLLHDVGHGPFGHFFDVHYLHDFGLTHETLGAEIITRELAPLMAQIRRTPNHRLNDDERLDPRQVAWLIMRPRDSESPDEQPRWLRFLRALLSGIYTIDNMDFVLRDAYMSGYSLRSFDLDRLLHHTYFTERGLTIHQRGLGSLLRFMTARAELFQSVYFHRTVRAIDLTLAELFRDSKPFFNLGNPAENLDRYLHFTEWTLLVDVAQWERSDDPAKAKLGHCWTDLLGRRIPWKMVCERNLVFSESDSERASIFSDAAFVEKHIRERLPAPAADLPIRVDIARHIHRPHTRGPAGNQNYLYDEARQEVRLLTANQLFRQTPISHRICRLYSTSTQFAGELARVLDSLLGSDGIDDLTNM